MAGEFIESAFSPLYRVSRKMVNWLIALHFEWQHSPPKQSNSTPPEMRLDPRTMTEDLIPRCSD